MNRVTSGDGTRIAFERFGEGTPVILVGGATCDRVMTRPLAEELAGRLAVINYDRRGRGDSGDTQPYAVEREIEDIGALIAESGGTASVYGHSSGAGLALQAASVLPVGSKSSKARNTSWCPRTLRRFSQSSSIAESATGESEKGAFDA